MVMATVMGTLLAIVLMASLFTGWSSQSDDSLNINPTFTPEIRPNAQNVRKMLSDSSPVILKVDISGVIGLGELTREKIEEQLIESREKTLKKDRVKGILLTINTPGGTVIDSDSIYRALKAYKEQYKVPVYAYVDGLCASGGMYIACAADKIFASPSSAIGSVGVIGPTAMNVYTLLEKYGIETKVLSAGKGKDELNPFRPWTPDEGANYKVLIDSFYDLFVSIVSANRPEIDKQKLVDEYGANIYSAQDAKERGYIDEADYTLNQTLALLAKDLQLEPEAYQVVEMKEQKWLLSLLKAQSESPLFTGVIHHTIDMSWQMDSKLMNKFLYLHAPGMEK